MVIKDITQRISGKIKPYQIIIIILLLVWLDLFLLKGINLTTADAGRHIKNGELFFQNFKALDTNFYSYTYPDFPFVNHHWGSGILFYLIWKIAGFSGLSFFYIILSLASFLIFFRIAWKKSTFEIAVLCSVLAIPLIGERTEVRPEVLSCFFSAIFFWILFKIKDKEISHNFLYLLPIVMLFWINTHVYFFLGFFILGLFFLEALIKKDWFLSKKLVIISVFSLLISFINPFSWKAIFYPFLIFKNYGYTIVENQSIWFLENYGIANSNFTLIKIVFLIFALSAIALLAKNRKSFSVIFFVSAFAIGILACLALRNFTLFGFFVLPAIAYQIKNSVKSEELLNESSVKNAIIFLSMILFAVVALISSDKISQADDAHLGLLPEINSAADFYKTNKIQGPIFNNYDIGGYLIFHLYPEKVFVDNRPEVYPESFFKDVYIPMQEDNDIWKKTEKQYGFNAIFFYLNDITPWAQKFLASRIDDSEWIPVFADKYAIIFLKNTDENKSIIEKHRIPREKFSIK
jgi:hypothetical protein